MSTYTNNSGLEKPIPGSQEGTWGGTVNTNYDLIDEAINGVASVVLTTAGTSGAPNTIEITDGATSTGRHAFISFDDNGTLAAADVYVQLTETGGTVDAERIVWIQNSLTSGDNLYLFQGTYDAGRDYVIANGLTALVRFTGGGTITNCYCLPVIENIQIEGTITCTGVISGSNVSGTNTGDNPGVTSVATSGALTGGTITTTGTITHLDTDGYKHVPTGGSSGQYLKWAASGSATWDTITVDEIGSYEIPAITSDGISTPSLNTGITGAAIRTLIGAGTSSTVGTVTQVDGGAGLTGSVTSSGSLAVGAGQGILVNADDVALDYVGTNNFMDVATDLEGTPIALTDSIIYHDATDDTVKKGLVSDIPGVGSAGVTSVASGNGMNFTTITSTGTVTLGTPGSSTASSTNAVTATSHTHAIDSTIARIASPTFTGTPAAPTPTLGDSTTKIATTAFVNAEIANDAPLKDGTGATGTWGISISGNAATASTATSATNATNATTVVSASQPNITSVGTLTSLGVSGLVTLDNAIKIQEMVAAPADTAGYGQIWCKTATPNELWFTDDTGVDHQLGVENTATGTVTSVSAGTGMNFTTITTTGSVSLDYDGTDSFVYAATDSTVASGDFIIYYDISAGAVRKDTVSALPFTNNSGTVTSVSAGNGMSFSTITGSGSVTLGTPGTLTNATTNSASAGTHTHAVTFPVPTSITVGTTASATVYPMLALSSTGDVAPKTDAGLSYNASSNTLSAGVLNATSARDKKTQVGVPNNQDKLASLFPILYTLNSDTSKKVHMGYFADEVEDYFPEIVSHDDNGKAIGIDYSRLVVPLIQKITELERRLAAIEVGDL